MAEDTKTPRCIAQAWPHGRGAASATISAGYPFGVQVATIRGCLKAEVNACTSAALAASQAAALLYSTAVMATEPPENTKSVKMKVMWPFPRNWIASRPNTQS